MLSDGNKRLINPSIRMRANRKLQPQNDPFNPVWAEFCSVLQKLHVVPSRSVLTLSRERVVGIACMH